MKHVFLFLLLENPYTYEWSFVSGPVGYPGVMEGKHMKTVKVSQVRLHTTDTGFWYWVHMLALSHIKLWWFRGKTLNY